MKFVVTIETENAAYALAPRDLVPLLRELAKNLGEQSDYEAASIHGYEGRIRDAQGNTIGKWSWETGKR